MKIERERERTRSIIENDRCIYIYIYLFSLYDSNNRFSDKFKCLDVQSTKFCKILISIDVTNF